MPNFFKKMIFSKKGIKNARLATLVCPPFCVFSEKGGGDDDDTSFGFQGGVIVYTFGGGSGISTTKHTFPKNSRCCANNTREMRAGRGGHMAKRGGGERGHLSKNFLSAEFCHLFFLCFWRSTLRGKVGEIYFSLFSLSMRGN